MKKLTFILGYLGSGKTTFLKKYLLNFKNEKLALVVNDFGVENLDKKLLEECQGIVHGIENGSIFCACKSHEFLASLENLAETDVERVIVECSGLASPLSLMKILGFANAKCENQYQLEGVICTLDAVTFEKYVTLFPILKNQIVASDVIYITKEDLVGKEDILRIESLLSAFGVVSKIFHLEKDTPVIYEKISHVEKPSFNQVIDIGIQKCQIALSEDVTLEEINIFSKNVARFCHRIKGSVDIDGGIYFEYHQGAIEVQKIKNAKNILFLLSIGGKNLKSEARNFLAPSMSII